MKRLRESLAWHREGPGLYRSGPYRVGRLDTGEWFADGPGVDAVYDTKAQAQVACMVAWGKDQ